MKFVFLIAVMAILSGCSTYAAQRYSVSTDNVTALRQYKGQQVKVGSFSSFEPGLSSIMCRGVGPIKSPDGEPYSEYVRKALIDELKMAEVYSGSSSVTLTGNLNALDFSSNSGNWNVSLNVNSSNGESLTVTENYKYTSSFYGETACNQTAQALMPAVQVYTSLIALKRNRPLGVAAYEETTLGTP